MLTKQFTGVQFGNKKEYLMKGMRSASRKVYQSLVARQGRYGRREKTNCYSFFNTGNKTSRIQCAHTSASQSSRLFHLGGNFDGRVEVTNPGQPLVDVARIIDNPSKSREEKLPALMRRMNMCEELGFGWTELWSLVSPFVAGCQELMFSMDIQGCFTCLVLDDAVS